jgi:hypothetical protein
MPATAQPIIAAAIKVVGRLDELDRRKWKRTVSDISARATAVRTEIAAQSGS